MKHWRLLTVVLVAVAMSVIGVRHVLEKPAQQKREVAYQAALRPYSEVLRPGMTRNEVESYLRAENVRFGQMCCVDPTDLSKGVYDDLTKIGQEDAPWFCSEMNIYVAFQFTGPDRHAVGWTADASDTLKSVTIYRRLEGCLRGTAAFGAIAYVTSPLRLSKPTASFSVLEFFPEMPPEPLPDHLISQFHGRGP